MKDYRYRWHEQDGILDQDNYQVLQLFSNSKKFRRMAGKALVELLNSKVEKKELLAQKELKNLK